jgi:hypothetical protein
MRGPRFGFIGILGALLIAVVAGVIGYNLGLGANVAATTDGATHVVYAPWGYGFGFGGFGLLFGILFFVLIFALIRRAAWGGRGWYGRGGWGHYYGDQGHDHGSLPPQAQPMFDDWHRRAHGESTDSGQPGGQPGSGDSGSTGGTGTPGTRT